MIHKKEVIVATGIISALVSIVLFCTDPTKPDFTTPTPFSFVLYSNSSATDTLNSGDTTTAGDTLFFIMFCNRPGDIDTLNLELKDQAGNTLFDTTSSNIDTSATNKLFGYFIPYITGTITLRVKLVLIDSIITESFQLFIKGLPPSIGNNKEIQTSGTPHTDSSFYMYISASGTDTLKYQWFKSSTAIPGQIKDTISFTALTFLDTGSYFIIVTNNWGADTSKLYNLVLSGTPPSIGNNKEIQTAGNPLIDSSFYLYISAMGTDTLKYQWLKDSIAITGQIKDTLYFTALTFQDTGSYHITVTNDWGADTSKPTSASIRRTGPQIPCMHQLMKV